MAVFESALKPNMEISFESFFHDHIPVFISLCCQREGALNLVKAAISAGIFNDLGSGSNVDACIIAAAQTEMLHNVEMPNGRVQKERKYGFRRGITEWKTENVRSLIIGEETTLGEGSFSQGNIPLHACRDASPTVFRE